MTQSALEPIAARSLVRTFCECLWNRRDSVVAEHLLADDFVFKSSRKHEIVGRRAFIDHVHQTPSHAERRYELLDCVCEGNYAFARVRVSFVEAGSYRTAEREGAALFRCELETPDVEWMLGDLGGADPFFHFVRHRIAEVWASEELVDKADCRSRHYVTI